jgi:hypothetical protein
VYRNYEKGYTIKHLVLGNGESRAWFNPSEVKIKSNDVVTWGCNAIYRDGFVDNLVAIDYGIQQEIYISGYHKWAQCWFADWNLLPSDAAEGMLFGYDIPETFVHQNETPGGLVGQCVISGKDPTTLNEKIEAAIKQFPHLDMEDLKLKLSKDVGVWITYVKDSDTIKNIEFPKRWAAGSTAIHLACQEGAKELYMLGFDLSSQNKLINNIYKGTDYYYPEHTKGFNPVNWMNELKTVFGEFPDTQFYWVDWAYDTPPCYNHSNVGYLTKTELCDTLNIL